MFPNIQLDNTLGREDEFQLLMEMLKRCTFDDSDDSIRGCTGPISDYETFQNMSKDGLVCFIKSDERIVGYMILGFGFMVRNLEDAIEIREFYIRQEERRHGFGRAAVTKLVQELREQGFKEIHLLSASMSSDRFWESCRFVSKLGSDHYYRIL